MKDLPDGLIAVVKSECRTCRMIEPVMARLAECQTPFTVFTQDDPAVPAGVTGVIDDTELAYSYHLNIEVVPTLIKVVKGRETDRIVGWDRGEWSQFTGIDDLGQGLPEQRPGCGARNAAPDVAEELSLRYSKIALQSRKIELATLEDDIEACFE